MTLAGTDDEPDSSDTLTADVDQSLSQQQQPSVDEDDDTEITESVVDNDGQQQAKPELRYQYSEGLSVCLSDVRILKVSVCLSVISIAKVWLSLQCDTETTEPVVDNDGQQQAKPELRYQYSEGLSVCLMSVFSKSSPSVSPLSVLLRSESVSPMLVFRRSDIWL